MKFVKPGIATACVITTTPAFALGVQGTVDPVTGMGNLLPYFMTLFGLVIVAMSVWKAGHAYAEHRSMGPAIVGLLFALGLGYGVYYVITRYGVMV